MKRKDLGDREGSETRGDDIMSHERAAAISADSCPGEGWLTFDHAGGHSFRSEQNS